MAYVSDESGKNEVYVTAFPKREGKWQISNGGGAGARWSRDGKELFYVNGTSMMVVKVTSGVTIDFSVPRKLCEIPTSASFCDVAPDGQRFLIRVSQSEEVTQPRLEVVTSWFSDVLAKISGERN